jgi:CRP-like cAMP-binding protein
MQSLTRDVETLRNIPLFAGLPTAKLKLIAYTAEIVCFEPEEVIVQQGDLPDGVYIIAEGEAEVWLTDTAGESRRLNLMGPHTLFGETAVLAQSRRTATVRAKDRVVTFKISNNLFLDLLRHSPDIGMQVLTLLAKRLERTTALLQQYERR